MKKIIMLIIVLFVYLVQGGQAQDNNTFEDKPKLTYKKKQRSKVFLKVPNDEWPSQVIFDTIQICYQGTIRWIVTGSPGLLGQVPPYPVARKMTIHCFCVLDKLRTQYTYTPYVDMITSDPDPSNPQFLPNKFMEKAVMCIREHKTLDGLVVLDPNFKIEDLDNETKNDNKIEVKPPDDNSGESDSLPEQPNELPEQDAPLLNF